jgi:hypothetical protein
MNALKAANKVSKIEDKRDSLRLRTHAIGSLLNLNEQEGTKFKHLTLDNLPNYAKEKSLSGLLYLVGIPSLIASWFKPKSILGGLFLLVFLLISIGLLLMGLVSGGMYYYLSQPIDKQQLQQYLTQHRKNIAITVHDEQNQLLGALAPLGSEYGSQRGALYIKSVPSLYWELIKAPSDKNLSFEQQQPSFWSLYKKIIRFNDAYYKGINLSAPYQSGKQYDTLMTRIAKGLQSNTKNNQSLSERFFGNTETLQVARHLYPYLAQNKGEEFKRWAAMHVPLFSAKDDVYGLSAIALSLFGKTPGQLNAGQQALLATSYHQQTRMALLFSSKPEVSQNAWKKLVKKTRLMATRYLKNTQPQLLRRILADLEMMQAAPPLIISSQWLKFIEKQQTHALPRYQHLLQRSELTLGKIKSSLQQNLQQEIKSLGEGVVLTDVKISLPLFKNKQLDQALAVGFKTIHRFYPHSFKLRLGESHQNNGAVISIQVANEEGKIIRSYQRGSANKRPIAGLGLFAISSLLLSRNDTLKTRYCNKSYAGIRNATEPLRDGIANCKKLNRKGHSFSLQQSIQQEKRLPLLYALMQIHKVSLANFVKLYKNFSLSIDSSENISKLAYELTLGKIKITPEEIHTIIHALTRNLYDLPYDNNPSIIDSMQINQLVAKGNKQSIEYIMHQGAKRNATDIDQYFSNQMQRKYMKSLFSIPPTKKNNPLKFLHSIEKKYGVDFLLVKSATSKTNAGNTKDKWLVGSVRLKQNIYSFTIMIGSDNNASGLGKNINHQQLMLPVVNAIIKSLQQ